MCGSWNSEAVCSAFCSVLCDEQGSRRIESSEMIQTFRSFRWRDVFPRFRGASVGTSVALRGLLALTNGSPEPGGTTISELLVRGGGEDS
jgi:hypothetical protein